MVVELFGVFSSFSSLGGEGGGCIIILVLRSFFALVL